VNIFIFILIGIEIILNIIICMAQIWQGNREEIAYATVFQNWF
jgi:hypothetical protein